jgi:hypothetical protein
MAVPPLFEVGRYYRYNIISIWQITPVFSYYIFFPVVVRGKRAAAAAQQSDRWWSFQKNIPLLFVRFQKAEK